ncbi:TGF-beta-activated kinase 1 and MAP3K7-binding protein 1 isoform X1 [Halyomorpha halys]|uniref:TGF-beta-activated kinase 1 and MAP3K7-binding protein 1 isoform X1 n=1 Tax=Halyomorpha halys TaxID=286706 RepID=UPI0006D4F6C4|nr:TGF-beta-activated kinase 1 and MAP3K7-binding protein 1-like isoform X1 [Halyomorpha halys]
MPTTSESDRLKNFSVEVPSWTDALPVCKNSGVGYSTNQIYRKDGHRLEEHPFEETSFHSGSLDSNTFLYGVFDGHDGIQAAEFAVQGLAAELLLGQLSGKFRDQEIKEVLSQAFLTVEKNFLESLDDKVAQRTSLLLETEGLSLSEQYETYPDVVEQLNSLNNQLSCGTTAVVALVTGNKLYVANVGDSRALLCKTDKYGVHKVVQLSVDHDLGNEDEILRLFNLGLKFEKGQSCRLGNQENTRCLGNYLVKRNYTEFEELNSAQEEPIIAEPELQGGIDLDDSCSFLLLLSDGLYKSLEEATGTNQVNKDIIQMVVSEFRVQSTVNGVAQTVVDKVVRKHHDMYMSCDSLGQSRRDDITLLVRNFNFPMPCAGGRDVPTDTNTSSSGLTNSLPAPPTEIPAYVDFKEFYENFEKAKKNGSLPSSLKNY